MLTTHITADLERMLIDVGAVKQNDPRLERRSGEEEDYPAHTIRSGGGENSPAAEDADSDWD